MAVPVLPDYMTPFVRVIPCYEVKAGEHYHLVDRRDGTSMDEKLMNHDDALIAAHRFVEEIYKLDRIICGQE